jgi:hypothetical protein
LHFFNSLLSRLDAVENYESLALGLQIGLGNDIYDFAILGEKFSESFLQLVNFDTLLKVADIDPGRDMSAAAHTCRCAMTRTLRTGEGLWRPSECLNDTEIKRFGVARGSSTVSA